MTLDLLVRDIVRAALKEELGPQIREALAGIGAPQGGFIRQREAARRAGVSPAKLRKLVRAGKLKAYGEGRSVLYRWEDIEALFSQRDAAADAPVASVESIMTRLARKAG